MQNHYEILGVSQDANESEIRKAYRSLSLKYHPDRNSSPEAGDKFREINEANEILSDAQKRQQYDHELKFGAGTMESEMADINNIINMMFGGGQGMPGFPGMNMGGMNMGGMNMGGMNMGGMPGMRVHMGGMNMGGGGPGIHVFHSGQPFNPFEQMFQQMNKPTPIVKNVQITLEQAYSGGNISFDIEKSVIFNGIRSIEIETITLDIPRGIDDNEMMILRERGNAMNESVRGDLKLVFQISNATPFTRNGLDLHIQKKITLKEALCGFVMEIPHLNGKMLSMNNTTNSTVIKPNYKKVVPNLGMVKEGQIGNLVIEFLVEFPDYISPEGIERLREIL